MAVPERHVNPLAVVQVQYSTGWKGRMHFRSFSVKSCTGKHADPEHSRILNLNSDLSRADVGVEDGQNVVDPSFEELIGIGIEVDVCVFPNIDCTEIVFVDIADDPDVRKVRKRERIRT